MSKSNNYFVTIAEINIVIMFILYIFTNIKTQKKLQVKIYIMK